MNIAEVYRHSMVIASDFRIPDAAHVLPLLSSREDALAAMGAHHVLVYRSIRDPGRVLVMIGVRSREPVVNFLRSREFFDWFDAVGVDDIPAVFAGELIEQFDLTASGGSPVVPGVVISAVVPVDDVAWLVAEIGWAKERFKAAGVRRVWVFGAFDDSREVLILQEVADEHRARRWIDRGQAAAEWMTHAGVGVYPPLFLGEFVQLTRVTGG